METAKKIYLGVISLAAALAVIFSLKLNVIEGIARNTDSRNTIKEPMGNTVPVAASGESQVTTTAEAFPEDNTFPSSSYRLADVSELKDTGYLRLINHKYKTDVVDPKYLKKTVNQLHEVREDIYDKLVDFMEGASYYGYDAFINSSFRSLKTQEELYNEAEDSTKNWVAKPGESEHHTGLAVDLIALSETTGDEALSEATYSWLESNCGDYGFILRYIEGKENITGIDYEFWHFRYTGLPHSVYMMDRGLVMEEYIDILHNNKFLDIPYGNDTYRVYAVKASEGKIPVPINDSYSVSSDNTGYWVVTQKLNSSGENDEESKEEIKQGQNSDDQETGSEETDSVNEDSGETQE